MQLQFEYEFKVYYSAEKVFIFIFRVKSNILKYLYN